IGARPGKPRLPWSWRHWNGSRGSTTNACSNPSATFRPLRPKRDTIGSLQRRLWNLFYFNQTASAIPGVIKYASAGIGTSTHLYMELFKHLTDTDMVHVPYKGAGPSIVDLIGGHVDVAFQTATAVVGNIQNGQLRALATSTASGFDLMPDLKPVAAD